MLEGCLTLATECRQVADAGEAGQETNQESDAFVQLRKCGWHQSSSSRVCRCGKERGLFRLELGRASRAQSKSLAKLQEAAICPRFIKKGQTSTREKLSKKWMTKLGGYPLD